MVTSTLPGAKLFYFGQFDGFKNRLDVHLRRAVAEPVNATVHAMYAQLTQAIADPVFHTGEWTNLGINKASSDSAWRLTSWRWDAPASRRLVVVNFSNAQGWANIVLSDVEAGEGDIELTEVFSGEKYSRSRDSLRTTGLVVGVDAWSAQIFSY